MDDLGMDNQPPMEGKHGLVPSSSIPPIEDVHLVAKPPVPSDHETRPHLLEVSLDELELDPEAPVHTDLDPSWHHSLRYFVSLHPRSEHHDSIPIPRDAPRTTREGHYLVSQSQSRTSPQAGGTKSKSWFRKSNAATDDDPMEATYRTNPVVQFKEQLELTRDRFDKYLVAFVWAKKTTLLDGHSSESITLVGRSLAPLQEFKFQRRPTTWGIFDVHDGHHVAFMRLKYALSATPGPVRNAHLADVQQSEVTIKWTPPANDHGAPLLNYKVAILLDTKQDAGPQWHTLCERTGSLQPAYVVGNLTANTAYMVDIRARNKVGVGDAHELTITTAPMEPGHPSKPWIHEVRGGCLRVAWRPPACDGGSPITAYKVNMRKILGASKHNRWSPFAPGESQASWSEVGTVGAAALEPGESSMYTAWVGPLESKVCEYMFAIIAMNNVGVSEASEMSDPYYSQ